MGKNITCEKCGGEFSARQIIDGRVAILKNRKLCLKCSPYKRRVVHICGKCGSEFGNYQKIEGHIRNISTRKFCLTCSPFGGHNNRNLAIILDPNEPMICGVCGKKYIYDPTKGHRRTICGSCKTTSRNQKKKKKAIEYKGGKCVCCGYDRCDAALTFHHVIAGNKRFSIGRGQNLKWSEFVRELDKCILVCETCHREIHSGFRKIEDVVNIADYENLV